MNSSITSFRLLIVHDAPQEAQRLSSMLHNAGKPCRAQHINDEAHLNKALEEQHWELLITYEQNETLATSTIIRAIRKYEHDIPVILLTDENDNLSVVNGMKLGANDVVTIDDDQHLLLVISRELENRRQRKITRITQRKCKELERRNQALLNNSRDGIAYIQDGMYLYANESYAEMLGFKDKDDIEFMPFIDSIMEDDHQRVKKELKTFALQKQNQDDQQIEFTVNSPDGSKKKITGQLFIGEYDSESCTQLIVQAQLENQELIEAELQSIKHTDPLTGLYNRHYLIEEVEKCLNHAIQHEVSKSFIFIDVDRFSKKVKQQLSITDTDKLLKKISRVITEHYTDNTIVARVSDHTFGIISQKNDPEELLEDSNALCKKVEEHLFEIGNKTLQFTFSIGICLINESVPDSQTLIHNALKSIDVLRKTNDGNGVNIYQKEAQEGTILASGFKHALENDEFMLLFQPILSLRGDETERYEVLLRMIVEDNPIPPPEFLKIASDLNLSKKIDRWVVLESLKLLQKNNSKKNKTQLFINLTVESLCDETLLPWMKVAIDAAKITPSDIVLQAKEAEINQYLTAIQKFTQSAKEIGINFCISNYSGNNIGSASAIDYIEANFIKIDGALSLEVQENSDNIEALENTINQLHDKEKITIIPFIEKPSILSTLWQFGVHCIQGNYLHAPHDEMDYEFSSEE